MLCQLFCSNKHNRNWQGRGGGGWVVSYMWTAACYHSHNDSCNTLMFRGTLKIWPGDGIGYHSQGMTKIISLHPEVGINVNVHFISIHTIALELFQWRPKKVNHMMNFFLQFKNNFKGVRWGCIKKMRSIPQIVPLLSSAWLTLNACRKSMYRRANSQSAFRELMLVLNVKYLSNKRSIMREPW